MKPRWWIISHRGTFTLCRQNGKEWGQEFGKVEGLGFKFGGLHGAVACAGIAVAERVLGKNGPHPLATFAKVVSVNLVGSFNVLRLAAEAGLVRQGNLAFERSKF